MKLPSLWKIWLLAVLCLLSAQTAHAQLSNLFCNVTSIRARPLPNGVRITVQTDGSVQFGYDLNDFLDVNNGYAQKPTTSFRLRLRRARTQLPAFVDLGAYPVDAAVITLGTEPLVTPYGVDNGISPDPRVDIEFRFYVPIIVRGFALGQDDNPELLGPREVSVMMGLDRRSIVITVIADRVNPVRIGGLNRSPADKQHHHLSVTSVGVKLGAATEINVNVLHTRLADLLDAVSAAANVALIARTDASDADISMLLPQVTVTEFLHALAIGYGFTVTARSDSEGGGTELGRGGPVSVTERLPLENLGPEQARLLFPDALLPYLHTDPEGNALLVSGSPALVDRIRRDLKILDVPRSQVRVEATAWEVATPEEATQALNVIENTGKNSIGLATDTGQISVLSKAGQTRALLISVQSLVTHGRARLLARPAIVVLSGAQGTLFLGQQRYVQVLQQNGGNQVAKAISVQIGYSLSVTPSVGAQDDMVLEIHPKFSTIDALEPKTGLPTVGIREINSVIHLKSGDTVVMAGLDFDSDQSSTDQFPILGDALKSRHRLAPHTVLIVFVTAKKA